MPDTSPTLRTVYVDGKPLPQQAAVGAALSINPLKDGTDRVISLERESTWTISFKATHVAACLFQLMAVESATASRLLGALADILRKRHAGRRITPADVAAYRARSHRARGWRRRQLALIDAVPLAPVGHLVKPSARRPGRRLHRRRTR